MKTHMKNLGQSLVVLLVFMVTAVTVTSAAVMMIMINSMGTSSVDQGTVAAQVAESGAENALIRLLRNPAYAGEVLTVGGGSATVVVTGVSTKTITSRGDFGNYSRTVQVSVAFINGVMSVSSWQEVL